MGCAKWAACGQCSFMGWKIPAVLNISKAIAFTHHGKRQKTGPTQVQVQNQNKKICMTIQSALVCCYGGYKTAEEKNTNCKKVKKRPIIRLPCDQRRVCIWADITGTPWSLQSISGFVSLHTCFLCGWLYNKVHSIPGRGLRAESLPQRCSGNIPSILSVYSSPCIYEFSKSLLLKPYPKPLGWKTCWLFYQNVLALCLTNVFTKFHSSVVAEWDFTK